MTEERSRRIDALLSAVLQCEPGQRQSLLLDACKGDEDLRRGGIMRNSLVVGMSLFSALCLSASNALGVDSQCDAVPDNIVANCGFETGAFAPQWRCEGASPNCRVNDHDVHSGFFALEAD